jgi:1,4-alpha-glucan branching enzyme
MALGGFTFVLHSHLPYVIAHGKWPHGTDWLSEATAEAYLPLLQVLDRLVAEGVSPKITLGITPILSEMLGSKTFREEFRVYLADKIGRAEADLRRFEALGEDRYVDLAVMWQDHYARTYEAFSRTYGGDLLGAFRRLQDQGHIEVITCAATHGYLPLLGRDESVQAQVKQGIAAYVRHFGRTPRGIWLPECAYRPRYRWSPPVGGGPPVLRKGVDEFLSENDLKYFIVDSHLLRGGKAIGVYAERFEALKRLWANFEAQYETHNEERDKSPYEPYLVSSEPETKRPVAVFTRDPRTGVQVWSGEGGYPGDGWYLEFHKKHMESGLRYWRVTATKTDLGSKQPYEPGRTEERVRENASHFVELVKHVLSDHASSSSRPGILVAPYDTELFGHWWFEGPRWLYHVLQWLDASPEVDLTTCGEYLQARAPGQVISLPEGSWGEGGYHWIWLNEWTSWTWKLIYEAEERMCDIASRWAGLKEPEFLRIAQQMARELLLLEASDWQFLISTWSARDYADHRVVEHFEKFKRLASMAEAAAEGRGLAKPDLAFLRACEESDAVFPDVEVRWWARLEHPP